MQKKATNGEVKSDMAILDGRSQTKKKKCEGRGNIAEYCIESGRTRDVHASAMGYLEAATWSGQRLFFGVRWTVCTLELVM